MIEVPMADLRDRVLVGRERVKFADADPYGHLGSGAYVDLIMSHRVEVLDDLVGFSIVRYASSGIAFPARSIAVSYLRPAFVGELLELGSWLQELGTSSFEMRAIVAGATDRMARALATVRFVTVHATTGERLRCPETLPSSAESNPLSTLPTSADYLGTIAGLPQGWLDPAAAPTTSPGRSDGGG